MSKVSYIPKDYNSVTPYLIIKGAAQAIEYYKKVFGATETVRMNGPDGKVGHAELKIGNSHIMLADENPSMGQGHTSAATIGASPVSLYVYLPDVDNVVKRAAAEGAKILKPVQDQFYGDRNRLHSGSVRTSVGHCHAHGRRGAQGHGRTDEEAAGSLVWIAKEAGQQCPAVFLVDGFACPYAPRLRSSFRFDQLFRSEGCDHAKVSLSSRLGSRSLRQPVRPKACLAARARSPDAGTLAARCAGCSREFSG